MGKRTGESSMLRHRFTGFNRIVQLSLDEVVDQSKYGLDCFVTSEVAYNEAISKCIPAIREMGGAYLGVGPCQNYIYITAFRPALALVVDDRLDNLLEHLLFKLCF